jgi:hypothetical protein
MLVSGDIFFFPLFQMYKKGENVWKEYINNSVLVNRCNKYSNIHLFLSGIKSNG